MQKGKKGVRLGNSAGIMSVGFDSGLSRIGVIAPPPVPTYSIVPVSLTYNQGQTAVFNVSTTNVPDGTTLFWTTLSGDMTALDFDDGQLTGSVIIFGGAAVINRGLFQDFAPGPNKSFQLELRTGSVAGTIVDTSAVVAVNDIFVPMYEDLFPNMRLGHGVLKLRWAYVGPCIRVRRNSDNVEADIGWRGQWLDTSALLAFVGVGNSGFVTRIYNQSTVGDVADLVQTNTSQQARIVNAGVVEQLNGNPALRHTASLNQVYDIAASVPAVALGNAYIGLGVASQTGSGLTGGISGVLGTGASANYQMRGANRMTIFIDGTVYFNSGSYLTAARQYLFALQATGTVINQRVNSIARGTQAVVTANINDLNRCIWGARTTPTPPFATDYMEGFIQTVVWHEENSVVVADAENYFITRYSIP